MRMILLTDLHIRADSTVESLPWVNHFCEYMNRSPIMDTLVFVLGDIIDGGNPLAFDAAETIFGYIQSSLNSLPNYKVAFIPGNHDYCTGTLDRFEQFRHQAQTQTPIGDFLSQSVNHIVYGSYNFLLANSIQNNNYALPGKLNLPDLKASMVDNTQPILFLHHSMTFEDESNHTGIVDFEQTRQFIQDNRIHFIFHGHTHAGRCFPLGVDTNQFGIGSLGIPPEQLTDLTNESEQFYEVIFNDRNLESIYKLRWSGGQLEYQGTLLYPELKNRYSAPSSIPQKEHSCPERYIPRLVASRKFANSDQLTQYFSKDERHSLEAVCKKSQYLILIADAGLGKTIELQHLAYTLDHSTSLRPVHLTLNTYRGESLLDYILSFYPSYKTLDPNSFFLILDGYDEVSDTANFKSALARWKLDNPRSSVCISMRSNFYSPDTAALKDFTVYQLLAFSEEDIGAILDNSDICADAFLTECKGADLASLLESPFYLENFITIYQKTHSLPKRPEMMDTLMKQHMCNDSSKFEYRQNDSLSEHKREIHLALTRFAYGLLLLKQQTCTPEEYQALLVENDRDHIKHGSLVVLTPQGYSFQHNIFKEYLIAKHLSELDFAEMQQHLIIPDTNQLNPYMQNVLGFLLSTSLSSELIEWVLTVNPFVLTRLEKDRINDALRIQVLNVALTTIIEENIWFHEGVCSESQLANFVQSSAACEILIGQVRTPHHFRSLYFALSILLNFTNLYGYTNQVRECLISCYQNEQVRPHEKRMAIAAIAKLHLHSAEILEDLIQRFSSSDASYIRLGIYEYLKMTDTLDEHILFLLEGVVYISESYPKTEISDGIEHFTLVQCLSAIRSPVAIEQALYWFADGAHIDLYLYDNKDILPGYFANAVTIYHGGYTKILEAVYEYLITTISHHTSTYQKNCYMFFTETNTVAEIMSRLVSVDDERYLYLIEDFIRSNSAALECLCSMYQQNKLCDDTLFTRYASRHQYDNRIFERCNAEIYAKTGATLPNPPPQIDYDENQKRSTQVFFDCLFNQQAMLGLQNQLLERVDDVNIAIDEAWHWICYSRRHDVAFGLYELCLALAQCGDKNMQVIEFFKIVDLNAFVINRLCHLAKDGEFQNNIYVTTKQRQTIEAYYHQLETEIDYHSAFREISTNSFSLSGALRSYMTLQQAFDFPLPTAYYLGLLEIPHNYIGKLDSHSLEAKYKLIEQHIDKSAIVQHIGDLVVADFRFNLLDDLMFGCRRYHIYTAQDKALWMCKQHEWSIHTRLNALDYLLEICDQRFVLVELLADADDPLFLELLERFYTTHSLLLIDETKKRYAQTKSSEFLRYLILLNDPSGIELYLELSKSAGHSPGSTSVKSAGMSLIGDDQKVTDAIGHITDLNLLPQLSMAIQLLFTDGFLDNAFHSLRGSLTTAFYTLAQNNYNEIMHALQELKKEFESDSEGTSFCNTLLRQIKDQHKLTLLPELSIRQVRGIIKAID